MLYPLGASILQPSALARFEGALEGAHRKAEFIISCLDDSGRLADNFHYSITIHVEDVTAEPREQINI